MGGVGGDAGSAQAPLKAPHRKCDLVAWSASLSFVSRERRDGGERWCAGEHLQIRPGEDSPALQVPGMLFSALEPSYLQEQGRATSARFQQMWREEGCEDLAGISEPVARI